MFGVYHRGEEKKKVAAVNKLVICNTRVLQYVDKYKISINLNYFSYLFNKIILPRTCLKVILKIC